MENEKDVSSKEILEKYIDEIKIPQSSPNDVIFTAEDVKNEIDNINNMIIQREEDQKLRLRDKLTVTVTKFLWVQLLFFNIIVLSIVLSIIVNFGFFKTIDNELATILFDFLKYYISATIAELLGMLVFILHYVFSKYLGKKNELKNK